MILSVVVFSLLQACKAETETGLSSRDFDLEEESGRSDVATVHESCILESLSAIIRETVATNIYLQEIKSTFTSFEKRLKGLEQEMEINEKKIDAASRDINDVKAVTETVKAVTETVKAVTETIKARQMNMLSEVRLISLHKMTNQTSTHADFASGFAVDGQFGSSSSSSFTHTEKGSHQKLTIDLGALFRIYRVVVWNRRDCCESRIVGTYIYADGRLLGAVTTTEDVYEFQVPEDDPTYARLVTLQMTRDDYLHVLEVQVWGTGPFSDDDRFA